MTCVMGLCPPSSAYGHYTPAMGSSDIEYTVAIRGSRYTEFALHCSHQGSTRHYLVWVIGHKKDTEGESRFESHEVRTSLYTILYGRLV